METDQHVKPNGSEEINPESRYQHAGSEPYTAVNKDNQKCESLDGQLSNYVANRAPRGSTSNNGTSAASTTTLAESQDAAAILTTFRRRAEKAERKKPGAPQRTTSTTRPAKRKRHEDMVSFHRNSCQLFSSLDGTLAQMKLPSTSSSCSSSSSPSPSSSPVIGSSTQEASLDYTSPRPLMGLNIVDENAAGVQTTGAAAKRPTLQRKSCALVPTMSRIQDATSTIQEGYRATSNIPSQQLSKSSPKLTSHSCYSSQTALPLRSHTDPSISISRNPTSTTTIHWTSPESRRREHAKIDAANSGFRLFLRKIFPTPLCRKIGGGRAAFWDDRDTDAAEDDSRSVRRFRVDMEESVERRDVEGEAENLPSEKQDVGVSHDKSIVVGTEEMPLSQHGSERNWDEKMMVDDRSRTNTQSSLASRVSFTPILRPNVEKRSGWRRMLSCAA